MLIQLKFVLVSEFAMEIQSCAVVVANSDSVQTRWQEQCRNDGIMHVLFVLCSIFPLIFSYSKKIVQLNVNKREAQEVNKF